MRTLSVVSKKGGTGKTTLTICLGVAAFLRGLRVVVADLDPQGSSRQALSRRDGEGPAVIETSGGKLHQVKFAADAGGIDLLLVDTPGTADANTLHGVHAADLCLVVSRPNYFDLAAAVTSATTIRQLSKPGLAVLNQAPYARAGLEPRLVSNAREALGFTRLPIARTALTSRVSYVTSVAMGRSPEELEPHGTAASEVAALWDEVAGALYRPLQSGYPVQAKPRLSV